MISRIFILKNPLQLEKNVVSKSDLNVPGKVITHWDVEQKMHQENLVKVIERIGDDALDPSKSIRVLARYLSNLPGDYPQNTRKNINNNKSLFF